MECLKMYTISGSVVNYIIKATKNWKVELTEGGQILTGVKVLKKHLTLSTANLYNYYATQPYA